MEAKERLEVEVLLAENLISSEFVCVSVHVLYPHQWTITLVDFNTIVILIKTEFFQYVQCVKYCYSD